MGSNIIDMDAVAGKSISAQLPTRDHVGENVFVGISSVESGGVNAYEFVYDESGNLLVLEDEQYEGTSFKPIGNGASIWSSDWFDSVQDVQREIDFFIFEDAGDENE